MVGRIPVVDVQPVVDLGRQPAKATVGEPFPVSATIFREGHDKLAAEVVLIDPHGAQQPPVRMVKLTDPVDRHQAWVTPDERGCLDLRGARLVGPRRHLGARGRHQGAGRDRRRADVHRGHPAARAGPRPAAQEGEGRGQGPRRCAGGRAGHLAPRRGAAGPAPGRRRRLGARSPTRCASCVTVAGPFAAYADRERALVRQLVRVLPPLRGRHRRPRHRRDHQRHLRDGRGRARAAWPRWASTSSTSRRSTPSARSTARGPTTRSPRGPPTPGRPGRSAARTAATTPSTPSSARSPTSTPSWRVPASSGSRSPSTSRCRPPPTTPG